MPDTDRVCIVYNKSNVFGLEKDAALLYEALFLAMKQLGRPIPSIQLHDGREPPVPCTICIHLEVPYAVWIPWATTNIMMVNSEWWYETKWDSYWNQFTMAVFRKGTPILSNTANAVHTLPWCSSLRTKALTIPPNRSNSFVWFLGGSVNKRAAAEAILPLWKPSYPALTVYCLEPLSTAVGPNVTIKVGMMTSETRKEVSANTLGHICISKAESFGYTAAEAEEVGALTILNTLPCYEANYSDSSIGIEWLQTPVDSKGFADFSDTEAIQNGLDNCILNFQNSVKLFTETNTVSLARQTRSLQRRSEFLSSLGLIIQECLEQAKSVYKPAMPPLLLPQDCPPISIVTLSYNRPKFIENACLNVLHSDYPRDKIEWIVVDDSDPTESASNRIVQFGERYSPGSVVYVPLTKKRSIGYKRNLGVERAKHSIILMMDDDDHYPTTSVRRRVAYLLKGPRQYECAVCTTIAMYDLQKGYSAVNVPPYMLGLAERCSEATLTFTKQFWLARKFSDVSMAEGEPFLQGREGQVVEMPPQQMIVALSHGTNLSGRKMPETKPGCFWGFSEELLKFLHSLIGVEVESADTTT